MYARIIANVHSGGGHGLYGQHQLKKAIARLEDHGWKVELCPTDGPGSGRRLAQEAVKKGADIVVSAGGDGTLNEVLQGLAGSQVALGVFPMGTINVWAREMGIPLNLVGAADVLLKGERRRVDLGMANERYFLLFAGIGADGVITSLIEHRFLKRLGVLSYLVAGTAVGLGPLDFHLHVKVNGRAFRTRASMILIGNTRLYAGFARITHQAVCDDGRLDMCIIRRQGMLGRGQVLLNALRRHYPLGARVSHEQIESVTIDAEAPVPIEVDGEPAGTLPMTFRVAPQMLTVIVPRTRPPELFAEELKTAVNEAS
ncbi:MAG TPA: diacylglycerol kinase family protein [Ktedonobacterales bacterium]|jgi:YegS/Rv2252/BmrU family lipid kinase